MDLINDFRDKRDILNLAKLINAECKTRINIMEVCGGHTHSIMKFGLNKLLKNVNFIHGPGCPVCVMPTSRIDKAMEIASSKDVILCTLADMLRVPGKNGSLMSLRAKGYDVRALYTPLEALEVALANPNKKVVFFAIGFETTTPMSAVLVKKTVEKKIKNLLFFINHITVPAPIHAIMSDPNNQIEAFLGPSHVSVIIGTKPYEELASSYQRPIAISGFEPVDILDSVLDLVRQKNNQTHNVYNQYSRAVKKEGNTLALKLIKSYFTPCDFEWRGLGVIKNSSLKLKKEYEFLDANSYFDLRASPSVESKVCICADILKGNAKPNDCKVFANRCNPKHPLGSCMVSSEGACAAYYKYGIN